MTVIIREALNDYITCENMLPPSQRWRRGVVVCGAMIPTAEKSAPLFCGLCGNRVA